MKVTVLPPRCLEGGNKDCCEDNIEQCKCCPIGRSGHRIIASDNHIYAVGGYNPFLGSNLRDPRLPLDPNNPENRNLGERGHPSLFKEVWKFNLSTYTWSLIDDFQSVPPTIASHAVAALGRWLFMFGGTAIPFGDTPTSSIYIYDLSAHLKAESNLSRVPPIPTDASAESWQSRSNWSEIPVEGDVPNERYGHTMNLDYPNVYIIGGTSGYIYSSDVYHLDLSCPVGKWKKLSVDSDPNQPVGRYRHETAFDGQKLFVFGGGTDRDAFLLKKVHTFNVETGFWESLRSYPDPVHGYPEPRKCHSCCQLGNDVFLAGGVSKTSVHHDTREYDDIWRFSMSSATWTKCPMTLPRPLYFHSAAIVPSKGLMYIFGGVTNVGARSTRTNQVLCVQIAVSSLMELAWGVVCHHIRGHFEEVDLSELGVPHIFHSRLRD